MFPLPESTGSLKAGLLGLLAVAGGILWYRGAAETRAIKQESRDHPDSRYCITCGTVAIPKQTPKGSLWITLLLLLIGILPGLIYEVWRYSGRKKGDLQVCPSCGGREFVPLDTPVAKEALAGERQRTP